MTSTHARTGYLALLLVIALDQLTKILVLDKLDAPTVITPFFSLVLVWNQGISFGMLQHGHTAAPYILSALALAVCIGLHRWLLTAETPWLAAALGLIMGGALGNVVDRLRLGAVVDFLDFHIGASHWPAFNVADSAICIGVFMLLLGGRRKSA